MMLKGTAFWAKVGTPVKTYDETGTEWSFDVAIDEPTKQMLLKQGVGKNYIKNDEAKGDFLSFKRNTQTREGAPGKRFEIVGPDTKPWDVDVKIGNGSVIRVKYLLNEMTVGKNKGKLKPSALGFQVMEHKEFNGPGGGDDYTPVETAGAAVGSPWDDEEGEVA